MNDALSTMGSGELQNELLREQIRHERQKRINLAKIPEAIDQITAALVEVLGQLPELTK